MSGSLQLAVRSYDPRDREAVRELNSYGLAAAGVPADADLYSGDLEDVRAAYQTGRAVLLVGEVDGAVVAMGGLRPYAAVAGAEPIANADRRAAGAGSTTLGSGGGSTTCEILRMRVDPRHQRRGYAREILRCLEAAARRYGYRRAVLLTGPRQRSALALYRTAGYVEIAVEHHGGLTGVRLAKTLESPSH